MVPYTRALVWKSAYCKCWAWTNSKRRRHTADRAALYVQTCLTTIMTGAIDTPTTEMSASGQHWLRMVWDHFAPDRSFNCGWLEVFMMQDMSG
jgi:hypothetical protein